MKGVVFVLKTPSVIEARSLALKLFTLLLALFLLLSFSAPAFALPQRYYLAIRGELDEHSVPGAQSNFRYLVVWQSVNGIMLIPVFMKPAKASTESITKGQLSSPQKNGRAVE